VDELVRGQVREQRAAERALVVVRADAQRERAGEQLAEEERTPRLSVTSRCEAG
jgi:hypothetical protein